MIECMYAKQTILKVSKDIIVCIIRITKHAVFNLDIVGPNKPSMIGSHR